MITAFRAPTAVAACLALIAMPRPATAQSRDSATCLAKQLPAGEARDTVVLDIRTLPDSE